MKHALCILTLALAGCGKKPEPIAIEIHAPAAIIAPMVRDATFSFLSGPCDPRAAILHFYLAAYPVDTPCSPVQLAKPAVEWVECANQDPPLTEANFPIKGGQACFMWDGKMHVLWDDYQHEFEMEMKLIGNSQ